MAPDELPVERIRPAVRYGKRWIGELGNQERKKLVTCGGAQGRAGEDRVGDRVHDVWPLGPSWPCGDKPVHQSVDVWGRQLACAHAINHGHERAAAARADAAIGDVAIEEMLKLRDGEMPVAGSLNRALLVVPVDSV